jgi:hypothetical protein
MKRTSYADPLVFTKGQNSVPRDLEAGIDTKHSQYIAWVRYSTVSITTENDNDVARNMRVEHSATIPNSLGETGARAALIAFFDSFGAPVLIDGVACAGGISANEAITKIKSDVPEIVVLVESSTSTPVLHDEDHKETVLN